MALAARFQSRILALLSLFALSLFVADTVRAQETASTTPLPSYVIDRFG